MIQLTKDIIAVEVPSDAYNLRVSPPYNGWPAQLSYETKIYTTEGTLSVDGKLINDKQVRLIGVTPLSEEQMLSVLPDYLIQDNGNSFHNTYIFENYMTGDETYSLKVSFNSLLESKGLDVNKKYAIIKIEK